jgi:peptide/nickel transport system ATP-binding protein
MLTVEGLSIAFGTSEVVSDVHFQLNSGEVLGVVGESGSGKSVTMLGLSGLIPQAHISASHAVFTTKNKSYNLLDSSTASHVLGSQIGYIFQEPMSALHPLLTCGNQIEESIKTHQSDLTKNEVRETCMELLREMELPDPVAAYHKYPHEFSGGQRQRIMIALAMANTPDMVIADEPTTALDGILQKKITELLVHQCRTKNSGLILISHDLNLVKKYCDSILVMYKGRVMEYGNADEVTNNPKSLYTKSLMDCQPNLAKKGVFLPTIDLLAEFDGEKFQSKGTFKKEQIPSENTEKVEVLQFTDVRKSFGKVEVLRGVNLEVFQGEVLGLLGPSGCGKSTLCRILMQLEDAGSGNIKVNLTSGQSGIQMIFQDPYSSLNPNMSVGKCLEEVLYVKQSHLSKKDRKEKALDLIQEVGLTSDSLEKYPHEFSGGQRQRISIARALASDPDILLCDESVSALDISIQAQILNLFSRLKQTRKLTYIFISHDLNVLNYMCDRIAVMQEGQIVSVKKPHEWQLSELSWVKELYSHIQN